MGFYSRAIGRNESTQNFMSQWITGYCSGKGKGESSFKLRKKVKIKSAEKRRSEKCDKKDTKQRKESLSLREIHENYDKLPEKSRRFLKLTT